MILILNCGSQSIKWKLFGEDLKIAQKGKREVLVSEDYAKILEEELNKIDLPRHEAGGTNINLIGHRVVHGGKVFKKPTKITAENLTELEKLNHLAPLHNPFNILGIKTCQKVFAGITNVAVFDTEFFKDLPEKAYTYALPENINEQFGFRRYGFHGISHEYVANKASEALNMPLNELKIITCHLGGGSSITAIKNGKAIDTSMGFTPMEGVVMMTRAGNIDAGIVLDLAEKLGVEKAREILNKESGLKGICGESEMLKVLDKIKLGDKKAKLAFDIFVYSIQKYIGAYTAVMDGCDVLVFTGSIGSGNPKTRKAICKNIDISITDILTIETDEEQGILNKIIKIK